MCCVHHRGDVGEGRAGSWGGGGAQGVGVVKAALCGCMHLEETLDGYRPVRYGRCCMRMGGVLCLCVCYACVCVCARARVVPREV